MGETSAILSALGAFDSYYFRKIEQARARSKSDEAQRNLRAQIAKFQASFDSKTGLIFKALKVKEDLWTAVQTDTLPPCVIDYLLSIFRADK